MQIKPTVTDAIVDGLREAIGPAEEQVLLHRPFLPPAAWDYVKECLDTGWVSSAGAYVTRFEEQLAELTGCRRAVATVNGTAALQVCLHLAGVQAGDEVVAPALTFVATANAIAHCGALPHFVDVSEERLSISPQALEDRLREIAAASPQGTLNRLTGRRLAGVCLMHCFGHPGELAEISAICQRYELPLIEDAAESLGSYYQGKHTGKFGMVSAVSFNGNKIVTTGGGGAILTDDEPLADHAKHLTTTAKRPHAWEFYHDEVGWNYRLPNINAALGVAQLEVLPQLIRAKRRLAQRYAAAFERLSPMVQFVTEPGDSQSNYWLNCLLLQPELAGERDAVLAALNAAGYQSRPLWQPMHRLPMYAHCPQGPLPMTDSLCQRAINIPSSADLVGDWESLA